MYHLTKAFLCVLMNSDGYLFHRNEIFRTKASPDKFTKAWLEAKRFETREEAQSWCDSNHLDVNGGATFQVLENDTHVPTLPTKLDQPDLINKSVAIDPNSMQDQVKRGDA